MISLVILTRLWKNLSDVPSTTSITEKMLNRDSRRYTKVYDRESKLKVHMNFYLKVREASQTCHKHSNTTTIHIFLSANFFHQYVCWFPFWPRKHHVPSEIHILTSSFSRPYNVFYIKGLADTPPQPLHNTLCSLPLITGIVSNSIIHIWNPHAVFSLLLPLLPQRSSAGEMEEWKEPPCC